MAEGTYPVDLQVERPETSKRVWAFFSAIIPIKPIVLIINVIVLFFLMIGAAVVFFISQLVVLFTGKYPEGMYGFMVKVITQGEKLNVWMYGLRDEFPPFAPSEEPYPITVTIPHPDTSSRGWAILTMIGIKSFALIPQIFVLYFVGLARSIVWYISQWAVLFTGKYPEGMHRFVVGVDRWQLRVQCFYLGLRDEYPPFSTT
jgi:Domain of unknown function (DUF4389)